MPIRCSKHHLNKELKVHPQKKCRVVIDWGHETSHDSRVKSTTTRFQRVAWEATETRLKSPGHELTSFSHREGVVSSRWATLGANVLPCSVNRYSGVNAPAPDSTV